MTTSDTAIAIAMTPIVIGHFRYRWLRYENAAVSVSRMATMLSMVGLSFPQGAALPQWCHTELASCLNYAPRVGFRLDEGLLRRDL